MLQKNRRSQHPPHDLLLDKFTQTARVASYQGIAGKFIIYLVDKDECGLYVLLPNQQRQKVSGCVD